MPELPEVETTRRGLTPYVVDESVSQMELFRRDLRWPVSPELPEVIQDQRCLGLTRRAKYLVFEFDRGVMLSHLGMSGSLRLTPVDAPRKTHDHWQIRWSCQRLLRFNDPRRFGALFWVSGDWLSHELIRHLGPEPLGEDFDGAYLHRKSRNRKQPIKNLIMDAKTVVGVGNIYAAESLFCAGIRPSKPAGKLTMAQAERLVSCIKRVLNQSIEVGGTTLRDYVNGNGQPGYFQQSLWVYGRDEQPCKRCHTLIKSKKIGQRASCYCPKCQA